MNREQTISWSLAKTAGRERAYRWALGTAIAANLLIGLWCLFDPTSFARALHQASPVQDAWARLFAATWIGLNLIYLQGLCNPLFYRWPNWSNIAINLLVAIVLLMASEPALNAAAMWPLVVAIVLVVAYYRLLVADIKSKP
jgi:hypothetical protein